ncbi:MAG: DNA repair protein [Subdoligranulum sp.]
MYFQYGQEETEYLSGKDEKLGAVIAQVGRVNREVDTDLFSAVVHHIVGQQISTKAQATIWQRMRGALGTVDAEHILEAGNEQLQLLGIAAARQSTSRTLHEKSRTVSLIWRASGRSRMRK